MKSRMMFSALLLAAMTVTMCHAQQSSGHLLVDQKGDMSLAIVDPAAGRVIASVPEGGNTGHEVAGSADGKLAYVPVYGDSGVGKPGTNGTNMVVIDIATAKVVGNVDFGHGVRPHCAVFGPKDGLLYVTTEIDHTVSIIDPKTLKIVGSIDTGQPESHMLAISHDGRFGYTANVGAGTVSVLDLQKRKLVKILPVTRQVQRISISMDDSKVFTSDVDKPRLAVLDTHTGAVSQWIDLPGHGYGSAVTSDGKWLLIAIEDASKVAVINLKTMKLATTIDTPVAPQEVLIRPDGKVAYVSCMGAKQVVAEFSVGGWKVTRLIATGKATDGLGWAGK